MRTRLPLLFAASLALLIIVSPSANSHSTLAQAETPAATLAATQAANPDCKPASVIDSAHALKSSGDIKKDLQALNELVKEVQSLNVRCTVEVTAYPTAVAATGTKANPVPVGQSIQVTHDNSKFSLIVTQVKRGQEATNILTQGGADQTPTPNKEYILIYVKANYAKGDGPDDKPLQLSNFNFSLLSKGQLVEAPMVLGSPQPRFSFEIFPDANVEGWMVQEVSLNDPAPILVYGDPTFEKATYFALTAPNVTSN